MHPLRAWPLRPGMAPCCGMAALLLQVSAASALVAGSSTNGLAAANAPPPRASGLLGLMLRTFLASKFEFTSTMNAALCLLPDNRTAAYFTYATFPAATISKQVYWSTSTDSGLTFSPAVPQLGPAPWYAAALSAANLSHSRC